jgi:hypothetical protein
MTKPTPRTEIQIETHEIEIIRLGRRYQKVRCDTCGLDVHAFTAEQAAQILNSSATELLKLADENKVHVLSATIPQLLCGVSLASAAGPDRSPTLSSSLGDKHEKRN